MKYRILLCACFCSATLMGQQPGQRFPNRPRIFPGMNQGQSQAGMHPSHVPPKIDTNGDGIVSREEILAVVRGHLKHQSEENPQIYRRLLRRFDTDKDGEISDDEAMELHYETERRMQQGRSDGQRQQSDAPEVSGRTKPDSRTQDSSGHPGDERRLSDDGLLEGIKIEGLNLSSDL